MRLITRLLRDNEGQDLIEYTLMLAFVALASAGLYASAGGSVSNIWGTTSEYSGLAANCASGGNGCAVYQQIQNCQSSGGMPLIEGNGNGGQSVNCLPR